MKMAGFSGDLVEIKGNHVIKTCQTDQERFRKNIHKQINFKNHYLHAVPIVGRGKTATNQIYIKMPLLQCENSLVWLSKAGREDIETVIQLLSKYLKSILEKSSLDDFNFRVWSDKVTSLKSQIHDPELQEICDQILKIDHHLPFYYGSYHGDLTLSNMFISCDQKISIDVIDFLDTFIESPIHDFIKIRQDTKHLWTLQLLEEIDRNKIVLVLNHIDKAIESIIRDDCILNHYYKTFQTLNLLRIIPYNTDPNIFQYLKKEILNVCNPHRTLCWPVQSILEDKT